MQFGQLKRRNVIRLLGGASTAAVLSPLAPRAQQPDRVRRIGMLSFYSQTDRESQARIAVILDTLQKLGWSDGRNVRVEYRWSAGDAPLKRPMQQNWSV
jgi:putative ABC transport system substrate-binding protein